MDDRWFRTALADVAHIRQGRALTLAEMTGGPHPVYGANGVIGHHRVGTTDVDVVALGCRGSCGTVHRAPSGSFLTKNVVAIWPRDDARLSVAFLAISLEAADLVSSGVISGQEQAQIARRDLGRLALDLPPIGTQQRIVDVMTGLDDCLARLRVERDCVVALRGAWYRELAGRCRATVPLSEVADVRLGRALPRGLRGTRTGDVPWFRIADLSLGSNSFGLADADTRADREVIERAGGEILPAGSVAFPRVGEAILTERKRILEVPGAVDQNHLVLVPDGRAEPEYLLAALEGTSLAGLVHPGAVPSMSLRTVRAIRVPAMSPERQRRLCAVISPLRHAARALQRETEALEAVRQSTRRWLLAGRLP